MMRRTRSVLVVLCLAFVLVAGGFAASGTAESSGPLTGTTQIDPDQIVLRVDLHADGSATWRIEHIVTLDDKNTTQAFESLAKDIRNNRSAFESRFRERMLATVRAAENATGREMAVRNVSVRTASTVTQGKVIYEFDWIGFAVVDGTRLRAGDAISGLVLDRGTSLLFQWPEGYGVVRVTPDADERRPGVAIWRGPETFASSEPRLVLSTAVTSSPTTATATPTPTEVSPGTGGTPTTPGDGGPPGTGSSVEPGTPATTDGGFPLVPLLGVLAVLALVGSGAWFLARRRGADSPPGVASMPGGTGSDGAGESREDDESGEDEEGPPEDLLSNEERVLRLLEENGGRMKQQEVVSELDWTDAKTSQVVGNLREAEEIEVFRIGRENVLALPEESDL